MKAVFFSDAHLPHNDADRIRTVKTFVRHVTEDADLVVVLGDLFDFYHGYDGYIYPFYREIIDLLRELAASRSVYFVEGNHEFGMGSFFESYTGVRCVRTLTLNIDDKHVFLCHGDRVRSRGLHKILKSRPIFSIMDLLGPDRTWRIAMGLRRFLSRRHKLHNEKVRALFRQYGRRKLREGYDAVIVAHSHMADIARYDINGRRATYMNTGDLVASFSYGEYTTGEGFTIQTYDGRPS
ncbi:MAG: UDP-2,3-diacylglucosamine diphosphatase [Syntrophorhabdales bacterium]|jgi:UDP-2,3-diacylglucosamine hydrolase